MAPISAVTRLAPPLPVHRPVGRSVPADRPAALPAAPAMPRTDRSETPGAALYGVAAYLAAGRLVADRLAPGAEGREARLELSTRVLADGGRVSVARRLDAGRAVGIEAVVG